jgi:aquaporin TIP
MKTKALLAEFIGTFALIFVGAGSIAVNHYNGGDTHLLGIALAHGLTIAVMVSATAAISGGHLNPAVTIGLLSTGYIDLKNAFGYILSQLLGAVVAAALLGLVIPVADLKAVNLGIPALGAGISAPAAVMMEAITTFFLVFVIMGTAVDARAPKVGGLFIGLTVALDILVAGPITGAAMNPARYFGPALVSGNLTQLWIYFVGPILGAVTAAMVYKKGLLTPNS